MLVESGNANKLFGMYRGKVVSNSDPLQKGRLKLLVPQVLGDAITEWAWPFNTPGITTKSPAVGQGIWVAFEGGNASHPIWSHSFGTVVNTDTHIRIYPMSATASGDYLEFVTTSDGKRELDLAQTLITMNDTLEDHEARIDALELGTSSALAKINGRLSYQFIA